MNWRHLNTRTVKGVKVFCLLILSVLLSCGKSEYEFSGHRAYFVYDNSTHLEPTLAAAMNAIAPGIFCRISFSRNYYNFVNNQGQSSQQPATASELQRTNALGQNNDSGIIVGFGSLSDPAVFYCYDAQCANCYEETSMPRYLLSMDSNGHASCSHCGRTYDMNNGGIVVQGVSGDKLIRYRASTTGPFGVLAVNN